MKHSISNSGLGEAQLQNPPHHIHVVISMAPQSKSNALNLPLDKWMRNDALQHKFTHKFLHLVEQLMVWFEFWLLNALEIFL